MIYRLCQGYQCLPEAGALLDQPAWLLRMHAILSAGGVIEERESAAARGSDDPLADLPMLPMGAINGE